MKIQVGDIVKRNNTLAIYREEVCPSNIDLEKEYTVEAVHNCSMFEHILIKYQTVELEGLEGEVNTELLEKIN